MAIFVFLWCPGECGCRGPEVKGVWGLPTNKVQKPWAAALPDQPPWGPASSENTQAHVEQHLLV